MAKQESPPETQSKREQKPIVKEVFGKQLEISPAEQAHVSKRIYGLLEEGVLNPESTFQAARELAGLKRADMPWFRQSILTTLNARREDIYGDGSKANPGYGPGAAAQYLMYLKYLGALQEGINQAEGDLLREGITRKAKEEDPNGLLQLCVNAKYLGVMPTKSSLSGLERELKSVVDSGDPHKMTYALGRLNYLGLTSKNIEKLKAQATPAVQNYLAQGLTETADRERFANAYVVGSSIAKMSELSGDQQAALLEHESKLREEAAAEPTRWGRFTTFFGSLVRLSERIQNSEETPLTAPDLAEEEPGLAGKFVSLVHRAGDYLGYLFTKKKTSQEHAEPSEPHEFVPRTAEEQDEVLAKKFWERNLEPNLRQMLMDSIRISIDSGYGEVSIPSFGHVFTKDGLVSLKKTVPETLAAYRGLALEMGYTLGAPATRGGLVAAPITEIVASGEGIASKESPEKRAETFRVWGTIKVGTGLKTAEDFDRALREARCGVDEWATKVIHSPAFTAAEQQKELEIVYVSVADLGFPKEGAMLHEIYARAKELGLEPCPPEVGPQIILQYIQQPRGADFRVAMKPILISLGDGSLDDLFGDHSFILHVTESEVNHALRLDALSAEGTYHDQLDLVFVRRK